MLEPTTRRIAPEVDELVTAAAADAAEAVPVAVERGAEDEDESVAEVEAESVAEAVELAVAVAVEPVWAVAVAVPEATLEVALASVDDAVAEEAAAEVDAAAEPNSSSDE